LYSYNQKTFGGLLFVHMVQNGREGNENGRKTFSPQAPKYTKYHIPKVVPITVSQFSASSQTNLLTNTVCSALPTSSTSLH